MQSPDTVVPARVEQLLAGAFPETQSEARLQGLARELRGASISSPASLRERVGGLSARPPRRRQLPRKLLLGVPVAVALAALAAFTGLRSQTDEAPSGATALRHTEREVPLAIERDLQSRPFRAQTLDAGSSAPAVPSGRAQDVNMWIDLRVPKADDVSSASQDAVRITREVGGIVVSSAVSTHGARGSAQLALRIPVGRLEDAVFQLSELGTVTGQRVDTQDLQGSLDAGARRIERLRSQIRIAEARLASGTLSPEEELTTRIRLEHLHRKLREARREHDAIARRAAMADLRLQLATPAAGAVEKNESGVGGAAHRAVDILRGAGSVAVFAAIVLSPLLLLVVLAWLALRARARRVETRLLDERRPGAPSPQEPRV
ncbi:MAG TPA: DUF4349 domain-containing protein [Gaiellaceae bacterium]|nr:DUF4349 domain-containing protein [Gaiellaceae bacterium]